MRIIKSTSTRAVDGLLNRRPARNREIERRVATIVDGVRRGGDDALPRITVDPETYVVTADGEELRSEPARVLPMAQRYFLF